MREAVRVYESLGAKVEEISLPHAKYAVATYYVIAPCEASSNLARYDGVHYGYRTDEKEMLAELAAERAKLEKAGDERGLTQLDNPLVRLYRRSRAEGFGPEVKRRIMLGTYALSAGYYDAYYLKALKVRRLIRQDYDQAFAEGRSDRRPGHHQHGVQDRRKGRTIRWRCTWSICTPSAPTWPASAASRFPAASAPAVCRSACNCKRRRSKKIGCCAPPTCFQQATDWHNRRPNRWLSVQTANVTTA